MESGRSARGGGKRAAKQPKQPKQPSRRERREPLERPERRGRPEAPGAGERRYWADQVDVERGRAWLGDSEAHHALRVMRLGRGDHLELIDGTGRLFEVEIESKERATGGVRLATRILKVEEPPADLDSSEPLPWLAQALIRPARLEMLIDGTTQLGLAGIVLFTSARTIAPGRFGHERRERLLRIMRAATAQSLGLRSPVLVGPVPIDELSQELAGCRVWVAHGPQSSFRTDTARPRTFAARGGRALVVGPEGGLTDVEVEALVAQGAEILDLGPRRLRSETAAIVGLARLAASSF